jgi:hypothetical protein
MAHWLKFPSDAVDNTRNDTSQHQITEGTYPSLAVLVTALRSITALAALEVAMKCSIWLAGRARSGWAPWSAGNAL